MSTSGRQLVIAVVKGQRHVELVMEGFLELGLPGATVVDAKGMGQIVSTEIPIFSSFRALFPAGGEEKRKFHLDHVRPVCGGLLSSDTVG